MTRLATRAARAVLAAVPVLLPAGCRQGGESSHGSAGASSSAQRAPAADTTASSWRVTPTGWGPIRVGMTVPEARTALGGYLAEPRNRECDHVHPPPAPPGVLLMIVQGQVVRVEVNDTTGTTAEGARVGDTEARIQALYPGRVHSAPHKYEDGHYLIVRRGAGADSVYRLVFETDGQRVTRFRGGRTPEVEWVEGCS